jgi:hypothetical protein
MRNMLKAMQALGIAVTGVGLTMGIVSGSMGKEFLYAGIGIMLFYIARFAETRMQ